jgi:hypothetical protein
VIDALLMVAKKQATAGEQKWPLFRERFKLSLTERRR